MIQFAIGLLVGLVIGACVGLLALAMLAAASEEGEGRL